MIYLDNAATALPRPECVKGAMADALENLASPGRGSSRASVEAEELLFQLRTEAGEYFDCEPEQVVLTASATHGLNIAIKSLAGRGDRVVISGMEHNAVVRPLYALGADVKIARGGLFDDAAFLSEVSSLLTTETKLCVMAHVSNVFGWILPVEAVARLCRQRGIPLIVDASQSAGCLPVHLMELGAAFIAMPGHKGLMGPQGTGLLLCGGDTKPLMEGGTGSRSLDPAMPEYLPDRLEPGTQNIPGAAGLLAGLRWVRERGPERTLREEQKLRDYAARKLGRIPGVRVFSGENQTGVLSAQTESYDCVMLAEELGRDWNIALRAGLHCAPVAHETAGTLPAGTLRLSVGPFNREADILELTEALEQTLRKANKL